MNKEVREHLIDRMIRLYGFENPIVVDFCRLCESQFIIDMDLETIVKSHEENAITEEDDGWEKLPAIGEVENWSGDDGWGDLPTIGELEGWSGEVW